MNSLSKRFDFLSSSEAEKAARTKGSTLIWPFGACEQHGPHLPLATDTIFAERIAIRSLAALSPSSPIWLLPSQAIGFSPEHDSFPGTISLSASFVLNLVMEVGEKVAKLGFNRLLLMNAHGGQIGLLESAARQLRLKSPSMAVLPCFIWRGVDSLENLIPQVELKNGLHAGLAETSLMLSLSPELVGTQRPVDGDHTSISSPITPPEGWSLEGDAPYAWLSHEISESGVIGDSTEASGVLGSQIETALVDHWATLLKNLMLSNWPPVGKENY